MGAWNGVLDSALDAAKAKLRSNQAVNPSEGWFSGVTKMFAGSDITDEVWKKLGVEDKTKASFMQKLSAAHMNNDGTANLKAIAGSSLLGYGALAGGVRLASGGGVYRDSDGNFDIVGIPVI